MLGVRRCKLLLGRMLVIHGLLVVKKPYVRLLLALERLKGRVSNVTSRLNHSLVILGFGRHLVYYLQLLGMPRLESCLVEAIGPKGCVKPRILLHCVSNKISAEIRKHPA